MQQKRTYQAVIGLEFHVHLATSTKMFCGCKVAYGDPPNTHTCPVCLGHPGALPVTNEKAVELGVMAGLALNCDVADRAIFARKNYFYPDLPKGYQISQFDEPICTGGHIDVPTPEGKIRVGITRLHLEEDAAKNVHVGTSGRMHGSVGSLIDFNRGGTPLMEIVTEPDIPSPEAARATANQLKNILRAVGVSEADMEKGQLRCDANVSIRNPDGSFGTKTELKNMNSFRFPKAGCSLLPLDQLRRFDNRGELAVEVAERGVVDLLRQSVAAVDREPVERRGGIRHDGGLEPEVAGHPRGGRHAMIGGQAGDDEAGDPPVAQVRF